MLDKKQRKILLEQNLVTLLKESSNPYQAWDRLKRKCTTALKDLYLVAVKSPDEKLRQIFNEDNIWNLLYALFVEDKSDPQMALNIRSVDLNLASLFADFSISACIKEYEKWNKDTPESAKPTIDHLIRAQAICKEIGYKYRLDLMEKENNKDKSKFICIWEEINKKHLYRLKEYVKKEMPIEFGDLHITVEKNESYNKEFLLFDWTMDEEDTYAGKISISITPGSQKGIIKFYNENDKEIKNKNLVIKEFNSQTALYD